MSDLIEKLTKQAEKEGKSLMEYLNSKHEVCSIDTEAEFDELLDAEGVVTIGGLEYYPSAIFEEIDPIAYSCGYNDFLSNLCDEATEIDGVYFYTEDLENLLEEDDNE